MKSAMGKFLLHRIQALLDGKPRGPVTPALEAAVYVHWLSLYETNPERYVVVREQVPELRVELAAYFDLTARQTAAHLELCEALQRGDSAAIGTRDFESSELDTVPPAPIARLNANFGMDWGLFYWEPTNKASWSWSIRAWRLRPCCLSNQGAFPSATMSPPSTVSVKVSTVPLSNLCLTPPKRSEWRHILRV